MTDEEFLAGLGDVFGFLIARDSNDIEGANAILANTDMAQMLVNMADFCLSMLTVRAAEIGVPTKAIIQTLAMAAQAAGPDILKMMGGIDGR